METFRPGTCSSFQAISGEIDFHYIHSIMENIKQHHGAKANAHAAYYLRF
jgi:hypothetical protein